MAVGPCRRMLVDVGSSPEEERCAVSAERLAVPEPERIAPPVPAEFWQPCPELPLFPHGQAAPVPSPKQKGAKTASSPRSRRKTSLAAFASPNTRFVARLSKATRRPSGDTAGAFERQQFPSPCTPAVETLIRNVCPSRRSRRKTSRMPFVSPATRFQASLAKVT